MITLENTNVRVLDATERLDYFDDQVVTLDHSLSPLDVWNRLMRRPQPVLKLAFRIRDAISSWFGVKKIGGFTGTAFDTVQVGDRLDFFVVEYADPTCLALSERDRHLDVLTCISTQGPRVHVTSSVIVHNWFGHLYMIPVGIAHKWIVRGMLRHLKRDVARSGPE